MPEGDSLYSPARIVLLHHVMAALRANTLFERDVDYIVKDGEIVIVDEHTAVLWRVVVGLMVYIKRSKQKEG